jgi:uncharacterized membrane protein YbhN (UPF0104 family)
MYMAGQWFAVARGADVSRILIVSRFGVPFALAIGVGAAASLTDFMGVVVVGLTASARHPDFVLPLLAAGGGAAALLWSLGGTGPLGRMVERELPSQYGEAVRRARQLLRDRPLVYGLAISVADALAAAGALWCGARSLGLDEVTPLVAMLVFSLAQIAGVLSMIPLGLGVVEASGILLLVALGADRDLAAATLVVYRLATLGANMLLGGLGLLALRLLHLQGAAPTTPVAESPPVAPGATMALGERADP